MRCPRCATDHRRKEGMTCGCGYGFVLNPEFDQGLTDGRFLRAIHRASSAGKQVFTRGQLYTALRPEAGRWRGSSNWVIYLAVMPIGLLMFAGSTEVAVWALGGAWVAIVALSYFAFPWLMRVTEGAGSALTADGFARLVERWLDQRGSIKGLLLEPGLQEAPPPGPESDLHDYGVERVLVVQRDLLVDLFVRNGFHASQRALIVSASGYPGYAEEKLADLLEAHGDLPVFLLHDSTSEGQEPVSSLSLPQLSGRSIIDLGLSPEGVAILKPPRWIRRSYPSLEIPLDFVAYGTLTDVVSAAMREGISIREHLERVEAERADDSSLDDDYRWHDYDDESSSESGLG